MVPRQASPNRSNPAMMNGAMLHTWMRQPNNFNDRLVHLGNSGFTTDSSHSHTPQSHHAHLRPPSSARSMAPGCHQSPSSHTPPSLCYTQSHTGTSLADESVNTSLVGLCAGFRLLEDTNGVLQQPLSPVPLPRYECLFWFLHCSYLSHDRLEWETHCLSHFCAQPPPRSVSCPLCEWHASLDSGAAAWDLKTNHVATEHFAFGQDLTASRPDFLLFTHLWQRKVIGDQDLKELRGGNHNLEHMPRNFVTTGGPRSRGDRAIGLGRLQHVGRGGGERA